MIILMGIAGAGKSMQGRLLADKKGYAWISTGEILRLLVTGKRRQEMLQGKLLTDEEMVQFMNTVFQLINIKEEFVLDGFPRTVAQADWLVALAGTGQFKITYVFNLKAPESVIRSRLEKRGRLDDTDEAVSARFEEYKTVTLPIVEHFKKEGIKVTDINGDASPEAVHKEILQNIMS